ncbi:hypothetical protein ACL02R_13895 [Streptomyces sp. MS19]|uniref:hypothetical protein n=1 Tax=Streptomyces sp. MS19 TaxID=3385972 RepID=UPI0039A18C95
MAVGSPALLALIRGLTSSSPVERDEACGTVTDWVTAFGPGELLTVAGVLAAAAATESDTTCRESELHALSELDSTGGLQGVVLAALTGVDESSLTSSEAEYLDYLKQEYALDSET